MSEPEIIRSTTLWMQMKGLLFFTFILLSTIINTIYVLIPLLPLMFINHNLWRRLMDYLIGLWLLVPCVRFNFFFIFYNRQKSVYYSVLSVNMNNIMGLMEILFGVKITISGTKIDRTEPALIIMNHRTCLDWLFFWIALIQINPYLLVSQKISLKKIIRYIPGAGWAMATNAYLFLTRRFEKDQKHIENMIDYYANSKQPYQLLLYPEGTDKDSRAVERSRQFALKHDLVHYNYVLHPRTTGFTIMLRKMRQASYVKNIYDVTIGYADAIVQSEFELLFK
ncbi:unnamed protein product, partial [Thelazia callipaeda]|uniref:PlsC domain-containing protein n=1 Tax=Thelazia callipaeda TaxID=103827 RepID=A0A0N5CUJ7_THECL